MVEIPELPDEPCRGRQRIRALAQVALTWLVMKERAPLTSFMNRRWWARIIRYLETSSLGSDSIEAINLIKMRIGMQVEDMAITIPLHGCFQYEVPTVEVNCSFIP